MQSELAGLARAVADRTQTDIPENLKNLAGSGEYSNEQGQMAESMVNADQAVVLLGQLAMSHPQAASLRQLGSWIAEASGSHLNTLRHGGNPVGAWRAGAVPHRGPGGSNTAIGLNARQMLEQSLKGYLLWGFEPDFDLSNPALAEQALLGAEKVVAVASFVTGHLADLADVILPLAPSAESEGTLFRLDGESVLLHPAGKVSGQCKYGWKILRRIGEELGLDGFGQVDLSGLRGELAEELAGEFDDSADNAVLPELKPAPVAKGLHRVGEVAMYGLDPLCRRAEALQETAQAQSGFVGLNPADAAALKLEDGGKASVSQDGQSTELDVRISDEVPEGAAWLRSSTCFTRDLGDSFGPVSVKATGAS